jgi:hypothetical protein
MQKNWQAVITDLTSACNRRKSSPLLW